MGTFTSFPIPTEAFSDYLTWFNVKDPAYGAKGDGVTDDTASIQAAIDAMFNVKNPTYGNFGGTLFFPSGDYQCKGSLRLYRLDNQQTCFRVIGASINTSTLTYLGTGVFITLSNAFQWEIRNLSINNAGARGTTTGINLGLPGGSGTATGGGALVELCSFNGFHIGIDTGSGSDGRATSSEIRYCGVSLNNNDIGAKFNDPNCLDHEFYLFTSSGNTKTFQILQGDEVNFWGGSSSNDGTVFSIENSAGNNSINNIRAEGVGTHFLIYFSFSGGTGYISVHGCMMFAGAATVMVYLDGLLRSRIVNSFIGGQVNAGEGGQNHFLTLSGCGIADTVPFRPIDLGGNTLAYRIEGCYQANNNNDPGFTAAMVNQTGRMDPGTGTLYPSVEGMLFHAAALAATVVGSLPSASSTPGGRATVTDATVVASGNFGAIVSGTGGNTVPVYSDGTNWRIG